MACTSKLHIINSIPKFDGTDYVEWSRAFNDILEISCSFLSKIVSGLEKPKPVPEVGRKIPLRVVMMKRGILMNVNPPMLIILRLGIQQMNTCLVF